MQLHLHLCEEAELFEGKHPAGGAGGAVMAVELAGAGGHPVTCQGGACVHRGDQEEQQQIDRCVAR
jgi:hypothetical protein